LSEAAFRAAGQALAAIWKGAPINRVEIEGIALDWADDASPKARVPARRIIRRPAE